MKMGSLVVQSFFPELHCQLHGTHLGLPPDSSAMAAARREQAATRRQGDDPSLTSSVEEMSNRVGAAYKGDDDEVRDLIDRW